MAKKKSMLQYGDAAEAAAKAATGFTGKSVSLPEGMSFFPMKDEKEYRLRFAPYLVGKGNPEMPEGSLYYTRKYYAHARIGMGDDGKGGDTYVCSRRTFNKPCAVCDYVVKLRSNPNTDPQLFDDLKIKERQLFLVRDNEDKAKGWRVLDLSYHAFGKQLEAKLKASRNSADDDEVVAYPYKHFFYLEGGAVLRVLMEDPKLKFKFLQAKNIEIVQTKEVLPDDLIDQLPCLDDLLIETPYKVLEKILLQGSAGDDDEDEDDEPAPKKKGKKVVDDEEDEEVVPKKKGKKPDPEEEDDDDVELEDDDSEEASEGPGVGDTVKFDYRGKTFKGKVVKVNEDTEMASIQCDTRDQPYTVEFSDVTVVKKGTPPAKPGSPAAKAAAKKAKVEEEDDEDDDFDLDDEEPAPKKKGKAAPVEDDDDVELEDDEEEGDEEPAPKKGTGKSPTKAATKPSKSRAFKDEDDEEDDDFDVEDDDDEEPAPKKKGRR